jgi:hypothetical protein
MRRRVTEDTPSYAAETIASAQVSGSHLAASTGLFLMLLVGMSLIEAPTPPWGGSTHRPEHRQSTVAVGVRPAFAQVGAEPSSKRAADAVHWCLHSRAPEILTSNCGSAAHPRAGERDRGLRARGSSQGNMVTYYVTQPGDPAKLGEVLLAISHMESPPQLFVAGSDALSMITPAAEARLRAIRAHKDLSMSTDGTF